MRLSLQTCCSRDVERALVWHARYRVDLPRSTAPICFARDCNGSQNKAPQGAASEDRNKQKRTQNHKVALRASTRFRLGGARSIQLSYGNVMSNTLVYLMLHRLLRSVVTKEAGKQDVIERRRADSSGGEGCPAGPACVNRIHLGGAPPYFARRGLAALM